MLHLIGVNGIGLLRALTEEVRERKAHPYLKIEDPEINRMLLESGDEAFWEKQARLDQLPLMKHMDAFIGIRGARSEEHTSELQSRGHLVCGLLLGKTKRTANDQAEPEP